MIRPPNATSRAGYSGLSIALHWLAVILIVALFVTNEAEEGSAGYVFHVSGGAIAGTVLLWRVWRRVRHGMAERPSQGAIFDLVRRVVLWGFIAAIVVVVVSGYWVPWSEGKPLDLYGLAEIPSPMGASRPVHEFVRGLHEVSGMLFPALLIVHLLGAAKHAFLSRDGVARSIFRPVADGR